MIRKSENAVSKPVIILLVQSVRVEPLEYASAEKPQRNTHKPRSIEKHTGKALKTT